jgi:hypothetical protein
MKTQEQKWEKIKLLPSYYYYNEQDLFVFTEEYHKNRGYCCGNGCLNCPFEPKSQKGNTTIKK